MLRVVVTEYDSTWVFLVTFNMGREDFLEYVKLHKKMPKSLSSRPMDCCREVGWRVAKEEYAEEFPDLEDEPEKFEVQPIRNKDIDFWFEYEETDPGNPTGDAPWLDFNIITMAPYS